MLRTAGFPYEICTATGKWKNNTFQLLKHGDSVKITNMHFQWSE